MKFLYLVLASLLATSATADSMILPYKGVYDGDTIYTELCGLPQTLKKVSIRLTGIDTPEIKTSCISEKVLGLAAKKYLETLLSGQTELLVKDVEWDKFGGRIDGDILLPNGKSVSALMIAAGHAQAYTGGVRASWCK